MMLADLWAWLENLTVVQYIGGTAWYPVFASIHVIAAVFVFGSLLMVDLRLLNLVARGRSVLRLANELTPWTWGAFVVAVVTGVGLFGTRASGFVENRAFQLKLIFLALAGLNMALFHYGVYRRADAWDVSDSSPAAAKLAGAASLFLWAGVMLTGRWIGHLI
jgi:hypothetical protein